MPTKIDWTRKAGDTGPALSLRLLDETGGTVDLTTATSVIATIARRADNTLVHDDAATITAAATGDISIDLDTNITAQAGLHDVEVVVTFPTYQATFPAQQGLPTYILHIRGDLNSAAAPPAPAPDSITVAPLFIPDDGSGTVAIDGQLVFAGHNATITLASGISWFQVAEWATQTAWTTGTTPTISQGANTLDATAVTALEGSGGALVVLARESAGTVYYASSVSASVSASQVKTLYESNADTNAFTDADESKLDGIAAGAQVNVGTDLTVVRDATTVTPTSSTGTETPIPAADSTNAGVMTAADRDRLSLLVASLASSVYDAKDLAASTDQALPNRARNGADDLQLGSTTSADTNDPVVLDHDGEHYVYFPRAAGNYLSVPDESALDLTGDSEQVAYVDLEDLPVGQVFTGKLNTAWEFRITSAGLLRIFINNTGYDSTTSVSGGQSLWIKATHRKSDGRIQFFTAAAQDAEPTSWTQLGSDVSGPTAATATNTSPVFIGSRNASSAPLGGRIRRVIIRDAIDGTAVLDVNPPVDIDTSTDPDAGQTSFTATTGQTVTVNRGTSGLVTAVVTRPVLLFDGTDDYAQLPASDTPVVTETTGAFTVAILYRTHRTHSAFLRLLSFEASNNVGIALRYRSTGTLQIMVGGTGGNNTKNETPPTVGRLSFVAIVIDNGNMFLYTDENGLNTATSLSGVGAISTSAGRVGSVGYSVLNNLDFEMAHLDVFNLALTSSELNALASRWRAGNYA